jgi:tetratricopeptide (TPR) repeat protein
MQSGLSASHTRIGDLHLELGDSKEALESYRSALKLRESLAARLPDNAGVQNDLAWFLVDCPARELRDPARALSLAETAVRLAPRQQDYYNTLGLCHYRKQNWKEAVAALEQAIQLRGSRISGDLFFLAMAQHQVGERQQAPFSLTFLVNYTSTGKRIYWFVKAAK